MNQKMKLLALEQETLRAKMKNATDSCYHALYSARYGEPGRSEKNYRSADGYRQIYLKLYAKYLRHSIRHGFLFYRSDQ